MILICTEVKSHWIKPTGMHSNDFDLITNNYHLRTVSVSCHCHNELSADLGVGNLGDLKQQKNYPFQFWWPGFWNGVSRATLPLEALGWNPPLLLASGGWGVLGYLWLEATSPYLHASIFTSIYQCPLSLNRAHVIGIRAHPDNPGWFPHFKFLNINLQRPFFKLGNTQRF